MSLRALPLLLLVACGARTAPSEAALVEDAACGAAPGRVLAPDASFDGGPTMIHGYLGCPTIAGTAVERGPSTPRERPDLELLAIELTHTVGAHVEIYDRLFRDVRAIGACNPEVANARYWTPRSDGRTLELVVDDEATRKIDRDLDPWHCLRGVYAVGTASTKVHRTTDGRNLVTIVTKGTYSMEDVAAVYRGLPGVLEAHPRTLGGDASTICVKPEGPTWHYVFWMKSGDCPAGCIVKDAYWFSTAPDGVFEERGRWGTTAGPADAIPPAMREFAASCER